MRTVDAELGGDACLEATLKRHPLIALRIRQRWVPRRVERQGQRERARRRRRREVFLPRRDLDAVRRIKRQAVRACRFQRIPSRSREGEDQRRRVAAVSPMMAAPPPLSAAATMTSSSSSHSAAGGLSTTISTWNAAVATAGDSLTEIIASAEVGIPSACEMSSSSSARSKLSS